MGASIRRCSIYETVFFNFIITLILTPIGAVAQTSRAVPTHVPPKRSSQIRDGFGINSDLPRDPYLPWNRWWWTRMFDAGFKWIRIGQYENSSDYTSWDWVEQKRGSMPPRRSWKTLWILWWTTEWKCRSS